jgi:VWFA-related protein
MNRPLASLAIFLMTGVLAAAAQKSDFIVSAEEVRVDVLVTENSKPVGGLTAADFEVFDNGVRQEVRYATLQKQMPVCTILVFDMSRSIAGEMLAYLRDAAGKLLADLEGEDHAALITFNNAVILGSLPTRDLGRIKLALDKAKPIGNSSLIDASYAGLMLAQSRSDPTLIIIFSDGRDTLSWLRGDTVLEAAKRNEAVVYGVSSERILGRTLLSAESLFASEDRMPKKTFLTDLIGLTGGSLMHVDLDMDLAAAFRGVLKEFRHRYLVTYTPQGVPQSGWHNIEVRLKNRSAKVMTRPGYMRSSRIE